MTTIGESGPGLLSTTHLGGVLECRVFDPGKKPTGWHPVSYFRTEEDAEQARVTRQGWSDRFGHNIAYRVATAHRTAV